jgi:hypothetical protein
MIDERAIKLIDECSKHRASYLTYINNLDTIYDIEFVKSLYDLMELQRDSLNIMMTLLAERYNYLQPITFTAVIIIDKYNGEDGTSDYYIFPQLTPNIQDGDKLTFVKAGTWVKNDLKMALAIAEGLQKVYGGKIINNTV